MTTSPTSPTPIPAPQLATLPRLAPVSQLVRLPDWQTRLEAFVRQRQHLPFAWGSNDCCLFAADAVLAITGHDLAPGLRGAYSTPQQGLRRVAARGGVQAIACKALGAATGPLRARVGDIVLVQIDGQDALGLCNGTSVLGPSAAGIVAMGMGSALAAWKVG